MLMRRFMNEQVNVNALFLGPKSKNFSFFEEMLEFLMAEGPR
jgi:hypothetical protein